MPVSTSPEWICLQINAPIVSVLCAGHDRIIRIRHGRIHAATPHCLLTGVLLILGEEFPSLTLEGGGTSLLLPRQLLVIGRCGSDAKVLLIPVPQRFRIFRAEEYSANAGYSFHGPAVYRFRTSRSIRRGSGVDYSWKVAQLCLFEVERDLLRRLEVPRTADL
jgi:hypothetical protein